MPPRTAIYSGSAEVLANRVAGNRECPEDAVKACTAALLDVANPFDLIPAARERPDHSGL